jgi:16S rRNA G1207 methylase RsmC
VSHYFETPQPGGPEFLVPMTLFGHAVELVSAPGVFSQRRLDPGTAVLLRTCAPPETPQRILDLGAGIGPIACGLALASPAEIWAVDVNEKAVELCARNAARLQVAERVHALTPDQVPAGLQFDAIWSNPPIRIGKPALHGLLLAWLARLAPGGQARLVVAKNLGADSLAAWLTGQGYPAEKLASAKGYRVLAAGRAG